MGIFDAIGIDAGIVLIIVILIQLVLIFFLIKQSMKLARLTNKYKMFMRGTGSEHCIFSRITGRGKSRKRRTQSYR